MLDFSQIATQIRSFVGEQAHGAPRRQDALTEAGTRLQNAGIDWQATRKRIEDSRTSWLLAGWSEPPDGRVPLPVCPETHSVLAADGSQIVSDRHDIAPCYVINIGTIVLRYGAAASACLNSRPQLALPDDDLLDTGEGDQGPILPRRLAMRRLLAEIGALVDLIAAETAPHPPASPARIALIDGSLILWPLEKEHEDFRADVIHSFKTHLDAALAARVPLVGYISQPQSRDVLNSLRVHRCPHPRADCDVCCPNHARFKPHYVAPDCAGTERVTDADLFAERLKVGERSMLFTSSSKIIDLYSDHQRIYFFYLHTGLEVVRIEIPEWVASDSGLVALVHALCYDQARKGDGYPVALAEAHELAVVRAPERDAFFRLVERGMIASHQPVSSTRKAVAKRARRL